MIKNDQQSKILIVDKFYYHWSNNFDWKLTKIIVDNFIINNLTDCQSRKVDKKSILLSTTDWYQLKKLNLLP
jgi:hypothetical protein